MSELNNARVDDYIEFVDFITKLRASADVWIPVPTFTPGGELQFSFYSHDINNDWRLSDDARNKAVVDRFKGVARAIGGRWAKNDPKSSRYDDASYTFTNETVTIGGAKVLLLMERDTVCERIPVGSTTKVIPAREAQPERIEEEIVYVRECKSLFANQERELDEAMREVSA